MRYCKHWKKYELECPIIIVNYGVDHYDEDVYLCPRNCECCQFPEEEEDE